LRTIYLTPVVISWVIALLVWTSVLHPSFGLNAQVMGLFGQPSIPFFSDPKWVIPAFIILSIWKGLGYWMIIFLAGLQGIPHEYLAFWNEQMAASLIALAPTFTMFLLFQRYFVRGVVMTGLKG
jgi:ABC-type sugar transport system permease subunit